MRYNDVVILCSKSEKCTKQLTEEYIAKLKKSICNKQTLLLLNQQSGQRDQKIMQEKFGETLEPMLFLPNTTNHLYALDVQSFHYCKHVMKPILEYSSNHPSLCGNEDLTTKEIVYKMHHHFHNQLSAPIFDVMRPYTFQKALQRDTRFFKSLQHMLHHTREGMQQL